MPRQSSLSGPDGDCSVIGSRLNYTRVVTIKNKPSNLQVLLAEERIEDVALGSPEVLVERRRGNAERLGQFFRGGVRGQA